MSFIEKTTTNVVLKLKNYGYIKNIYKMTSKQKKKKGIIFCVLTFRFLGEGSPNNLKFV